jgi:AcrR family transcriptional regulator
MSRAQRTRAALLAAALDLFERQGYDATTAAEVAAAAGVTEMTFFRHFASKAALLLEDPYDPLVAESVAATPAEWPAVVRVAEGLREAFAGLSAELSDHDLADMRRRLRIAAATASLRPAVVAGTSDTADAVAERLAAAGEDPATARVAAVAVLAGVTEALLLWASSTPDGTGPDLAAALGTACDVLAAGR